ncbi:MADS-box protein SVP-like [Solanum pennellii]|uniref:MADS-box protein SVP-like n=1 Tax=Solanum pennellii TaxID=28526 RepID=A0ABM1UW75_SOLPN|nr:MADS-box protein SVP-like [Solanum pennellii]
MDRENEDTKKFYKRCSSLLRKAEEIAICCDVDVLFVALSPSNRLNKFCSQKRIEDMLQHYLKIPVERRLTIENLELQIKKCTLELQIVDANLRDYVPESEKFSSLHQLFWCESNLQKSLQKVMTRKIELEKQEKMVVHFAAQQTTPQRFVTNNWYKYPKKHISRLDEQGKKSSEQFLRLHIYPFRWKFFTDHVSTWNNNFSEPSHLGLENVHSNWNNNINNNNNNNHIIQQNDPSSVQSDAMTPNVNEFNNSMEENMMENDACKWDDIDAFLNEALNEEDF